MSNNKDFKVKNSIKPTVYHEALGTVVSGAESYYLSGASYDGVSFSVSAQETSPGSLFFKSDGTKMYVCGNSGDDVNEYSLSTAWDVSTASYTTAFSVSANAPNPEGIYFKPDGTKMYVWGITNSVIAEYDLSAAWDVSTASLNDTATFTSQVAVNNGQDITFNGDGTKLYIIGDNPNIYQYSLSTAYDITTTSYDNVSLNVSAYSNNRSDLTFNSDGTRLYVVAYGPDTVAEYALSTAYNLSTASYNNVSFDISGQMATSQGIYLKPDGTKMYIIGQTAVAVYQYSTVLNTASLDLSTGSVFDYTPTSDVQVTLTNPATSGTSSGATLLLGSEDSTGVGSTFSTTLYTGTGATNSIDNGLDLASDGGLVWIKKRNSATNSDHMLFDTERGANNRLRSNTTDQAYAVTQQLNSFNSNGFTLGTDSPAAPNVSGDNYASWSFKKQTKFFDIVTWTGNAVEGRQIPHNLGTTVGCVMIKNTSNSENWMVYHIGSGIDGQLNLNSTAAATDDSSQFNDTVPSSTVLTLGSNAEVNANGQTYVAYFFAHDTDASSLIKCGSYNGNGSTNGPEIDLGWEPQWVLIKAATRPGGENWVIYDAKRGLVVSAGDPAIFPSDSAAEDFGQGADNSIDPQSTGFKIVGTSGPTNDSYKYVYVAIRSESIPTVTYDPNLQWSGGTAPTLPATGEKDVITFNTTDGGTTYKSALAIDGAK